MMYLPFRPMTVPASKNFSFVTCTMYWLLLSLASSAVSTSPAYMAMRSPFVAFSCMNKPMPAPGICDCCTAVRSTYARCFFCADVEVPILALLFGLALSSAPLCSSFVASCFASSVTAFCFLCTCGFCTSFSFAVAVWVVVQAFAVTLFSILCSTRSSLRLHASALALSASAVAVATVVLVRCFSCSDFLSFALFFLRIVSCLSFACCSVRPCTLCLSFFPVAVVPALLRCRFTLSSCSNDGKYSSMNPLSVASPSFLFSL